MGPGDKIALIDGSGLMHRAYHSAPNLTRPSDGAPVGATYRLAEMLWRLRVRFLADHTHIAAFLDAGGHTPRHTINPAYKAQRRAHDPAFTAQRAFIRECFAAFLAPEAIVEVGGVEADDLIGWYTDFARQEDALVTIVSADKDLFQLIRPGVKCLARRGKIDVLVDSDECFAMMGVRPDQIPDFLALTGDTSDNIIGVPGVGAVKAARLLLAYETLDGVFTHGPRDATPALRATLMDPNSLATARLARRQTGTLPCPLQSVDFEPFVATELSEPRLRAFFEAMEFSSFLALLDDGASSAWRDRAPPLPAGYEGF